MDENCEKPALQKDAEELFVTSCVSTCTKMYRKESSDELKNFKNNCQLFSQDQNRSVSLGSVAASTADILDRALLQCLPQAAWKTVTGPWELAKALPALVSHLLSGSWSGTKVPGRDVQAEMKACAANVDCRRAMARNTIRFQEMNSDGTWKVSDEDMDKQLSQVSFNDLHQQAVHDRSLSQNECLTKLGSLRREVSSDGEDWTLERHQKVYNTLSREAPHCPGVLKLMPPDFEEKQKQECIANSPNPIDCLMYVQKVALGTACEGKVFTDKHRDAEVEFCAEVVSALIPVPFVGPATKVLKAAKAELNIAKATEGAVESTVTKAAVADATTVAEKEVVNAAAGRSELGGSSRGVEKSTQTASRPEKLNTFVENYKSNVPVSKEQNARFISLAEDSAKASKENRTRFFETENSQMQNLNTATKDKELVTSATNYQKEVLLSRLDKLKAKYPGVKFELYSDFKTVKVGVLSDKPFDAATEKALFNDLSKVYSESNTAFASKMKELGVKVPEAGDADKWFKAGFGKDYEKASLAARRGRSVDGDPRVLDFDSPEVRGHLEDRLKNVESRRADLASSSTMKPLMEKNSSGTTLPKQEVFDLIRKNKSPDELASAISKRYNLSSFSVGDAKKLQEYAKGVDEFSPTLLIPERVNPTLDNAVGGGLTADFLGMGSSNAKATADALASSRGLDDAIEKARLGEKTVTKTFQQRMTAFKKVVGGDVVCTGDDCVRTATKALTENEKTKIMKALASNPETRGVRMSFIGPDVVPEARMVLASHGESIEKAFRKELEGKVSFDKLQKMTFGFDMKTSTLNQGTVNLIVGKPSLTRLTVKEQEDMQRAFAKALADYNKTSNYTQGTSRMSTPTLRLVPGLGITGTIDQPSE